jgi:hypothetical protein
MCKCGMRVREGGGRVGEKNDSGSIFTNLFQKTKIFVSLGLSILSIVKTKSVFKANIIRG